MTSFSLLLLALLNLSILLFYFIFLLFLLFYSILFFSFEILKGEVEEEKEAGRRRKVHLPGSNWAAVRLVLQPCCSAPHDLDLSHLIARGLNANFLLSHAREKP